MSCENCRDIEEKDGVEPMCCPIPPLTPDGARVLEMRAKLITLGELVGKETILKMYGATREDIKMLEAVEEEMKEVKGG